MSPLPRRLKLAVSSPCSPVMPLFIDVGVGVAVGMVVGVMLGVAVGEIEAVAEGVTVAVKVAVTVGVAVAVLVIVGVGVGVAVGTTEFTALKRFKSLEPLTSFCSGGQTTALFRRADFKSAPVSAGLTADIRARAPVT